MRPYFSPKRCEIFVKAAELSSAIMTAHIAFEEEPQKIFSLDQELLKEFKKGFREDLVWITDDLLSMKAVADKKPWLKALECGYDFISICGTLEESLKAIEESIRYSETAIQGFKMEQELEKR